jgi:hypothetical protein
LSSQPVNPRAHALTLACALVALILLPWHGPPMAATGDTPWGTVRGRVTNAATGEPLGSVNVYFAFTSVGTSTDSGGRYALRIREAGAYDMVFSIIGFIPRKERVEIRPGDSLRVDVALEPTVIETGTVEVTSTPDVEWEKELREFTRAFIGHSGYADECAIVNPEIIRFERSNDTLIARSGHIINVDNRALGYRIHVVIGDFLWNITMDAGRFLIYPWFEEMHAADPGEQTRWSANRESAYMGSPRHFFNSLIHRTTEAQRFMMYSGSLLKLVNRQGHRVTDEDFLVEPHEGDPVYTIQFPGHIRIEYGESPPDLSDPRDRPGQPYYGNRPVTRPPRVSYMHMTGSTVIVDSTGNLFDPLSIEVSGDWAMHRIESLLPRN